MSKSQFTFILFFSLLVIPCPVFAQDSVIGLTSLPPLLARPGAFVTAVFTLENQGALEDTFDLDLLLPEGFALVADLTAVTVAAASEALIFVTVLVPQDAAANEFILRLTATSRSDSTNSVSSNAIIRVLETAQLDAFATQGQKNLQDQIVLTFVVINRGNVTDTVTMTVTSGSGFEIEFSPITAKINPGEPLEIQVSVHIPRDAGASQRRDRITLTATSTTFPEVVAQAAASIVLLPPPAQQVDTNLSFDLPSQATIDILESQQPNEFFASANLTGSGTLNDKHLSTRLTVDNTLTIRALAVDLNGPLLRLGLGDVAASFDSFTSISGRGARLTVRSPLALSQLTLLMIPTRKRFSLGLNSGILFLETDLRVSVVARFEQDQTDSIISAFLKKDITALFGLTGQAALSHANGFLDSAFKVEATFDQKPLTLDLVLQRVGPHFLNSTQDQARLNLKQTLSMGPLVVQSLLNLSLTNVNADPSKQTLGSSKLSVIARALPDLTLPSILVSVNYQMQKEFSKTSSVDLQQLLASFALQQPLKFVSLRVSMALERNTNHLSQIDSGNIVLDALLGWNKSGFSGSLGLSDALDIDFSAGLVVDHAFRLTTSFGANTPLGALSFRLTYKRPLTKMSAMLSSRVEDVTLGVSGRFELTNTDLTGFRIKVNMTKSFNLPVPFILTKSQIEGVVFTDTNDNGRSDAGEGIANLILVGGGTRAVTDQKGFFRFPPLAPGNYLINLEGLPPRLAAAGQLPQAVSLQAGQRVRMSIPLRPVSSIEGLVFNDQNQNGEADIGEAGITNVRMALTAVDGLTHLAHSTANGRFSFVDIPAGTYTLTPDKSTFPARFVLTTAQSLSVQVNAQQTVQVFVGLVEKPPEIRITFSEPQAVFSFSPSEPRVGEVVHFDASASNDPDGEIVKYEWDFDGNGVVDAQGRTVEFTFPSTGAILVTLTVTDNDGNTGQDIKTIQIQS